MGSWQELDARQMPWKLTPALALVASLDYMANADQEYTLEETNAVLTVAFRAEGLEGIDYEELVTQGTTYSKNTSLEDFLAEAEPILTEAQKLCILTNLADISFINEPIVVEERKVLTAFLQAFGISPDQARPYFHGIRVKNNLAAFNTPGTPQHHDQLTPAMALYVSLVYMADADNRVSLEEQDLLLTMLLRGRGLAGLDFKELERRGMSYYDNTTLATFLDEAAPILNEAQKLCILTNLADISFVDLQIAEEEDETFAAFLNAFGISAEQLEPYLLGIQVKNDLSVFYA